MQKEGFESVKQQVSKFSLRPGIVKPYRNEVLGRLLSFMATKHRILFGATQAAITYGEPELQRQKIRV
jgi:hypothetical protein